MNDFASRLLAWHRRHGRHDLPWQNTHDPYRIWLSEIMLQQTRVETVIPYYARFLARFPDLAALAAAPLDDVLAFWSGLGYYARARNLHRTACLLVERWDGRFPPTATEIATLPGIGRSTAAAIAAFAFGERGAILDGNVRRVLCRAFGVEGHPGERSVETGLWALAESLVPERDIESYIQAQMDLGATVCTRSRPDCERCPLAQAPGCQALAQGRVEELPAPRPRKVLPQRSVRVAVIRTRSEVLLERRPPHGIWGGLLGLPELAGHHADDRNWLRGWLGVEVPAGIPLETVRHAFTHFRLDIHPVSYRLAGKPLQPLEDRYLWTALDRLDAAGLPAPVRRILDALDASELPDRTPGHPG